MAKSIVKVIEDQLVLKGKVDESTFQKATAVASRIGKNGKPTPAAIAAQETLRKNFNSLTTSQESHLKNLGL